MNWKNFPGNFGFLRSVVDENIKRDVRIDFSRENIFLQEKTSNIPCSAREVCASPDETKKSKAGYLLFFYLNYGNF